MLYYTAWARERKKRTRLLYGFAVDESVCSPESEGSRSFVVASLREFGDTGKRRCRQHPMMENAASV